MPKKVGAEAKTSVDVVFVVNQLHYRNNDPGHNSATVRGIFRNKSDAVAFLNKVFDECLSEYEYRGRPIEISRYGDRRIVSEESEREADTDEFEIQESEIH
jgi:hypothetical protein